MGESLSWVKTAQVVLTHAGRSRMLINRARQNRIDTHTLRTVFGGQCLSQADQPAFARSVGGYARKCETGADKGRGEDRRAGAALRHLATVAPVDTPHRSWVSCQAAGDRESPPSTSDAVPVTKAESSDARYSTERTSSSGVATRIPQLRQDKTWLPLAVGSRGSSTGSALRLFVGHLLELVDGVSIERPII